MTTGNVSQYSDSCNNSSRIWSGGNTPKGQPRMDHEYTLNRVFNSATKFRSRFWTGSAWVGETQEYVSGVSGRAVLPDWGVSPNLALNTWNDLGTKIKGNSFNTGVFLSQLPMAVNQLVGITGSLFAGFHALRKGDLTSAVRAFTRASGINTMKSASLRQRPSRFIASDLTSILAQMLNRNYKSLKGKDIAATWLALQYGVLPSLADISDLADFIASYHENRRIVVKASKGWRDERLIAFTGGNTTGKLEITQNLKYCLKASFVENPPSNSWIGQFDPFTIAWELVPWSFVIDWILPIGTMLENVAMFRGLNVDITRSTLRTATSQGRNLGINGISGGMGRVWDRGSVRDEKVEFIRQVHVPLILPLPAVNRWQKAFSTKHLENSAALFDQSRRAFHR